jgi:hypothetical protein
MALAFGEDSIGHPCRANSRFKNDSVDSQLAGFDSRSKLTQDSTPKQSLSSSPAHRRGGIGMQFVLQQGAIAGKTANKVI